jgi:sugar phosphate isomerase/epimerase
MIRRQFIRDTSLLTTASLFTLNHKTAMMKSLFKSKSGYGIQLYTVRDDMQKDPIGTLKLLADIGYVDVECAGYSEGKFYGMPRKEFKNVLNDLGLKMNSGHTSTGNGNPSRDRTMINNWEAACEDAAYMGQKYIVCAWLSKEETASLDRFKEIAALFNRCGEKAKEYGIGFAFHNHTIEFMEIDGIVPYDLLLSETDPSNVNYELDLYWITKAGKDPLKYFSDHKGRFPLWHVKDMEDSEDKYFTEVGNGVIDWVEIFKKEQDSGMKYFYVEQDVCRNHKPLESVRISYDYLQSIGV